MKNLTKDEIRAEYDYRYLERLGILCGDRPPTRAQDQMAKSEALAQTNEVVAAARKGELES